MYSIAKKLVLKILKVPPEPTDPMGESESVKVFRASYNYYRYRFYLWLIKIISGFIGTVVFAGFAVSMIIGGLAGFSLPLALILAAAVLILIFGFALVQVFISYTILRLDYEMRWYKVSDRSLRIREGVTGVKELTMTFANIQNISISQGPLQRIFKIADLKVETAGGGGTSVNQENPHASANMHIAYFRGVDNAEEIYQLMRKRLKAIQNSGLGDNEEPDETEIRPIAPPDEKQLGLIEQIRDEARLFRRTCEKLAS